MKKIYIFLSLVLLTFSIKISGQTNAGLKDLNTRFKKLMENYGEKLKTVEVEYIVAIDLSKSMSGANPKNINYFDPVKTGLSQFIDAIPAGSKLTIIGFGDNIQTILSENNIDQNTKTIIKNTLSDIRATQGSTDLKGAVREILNAMSRNNTPGHLKYTFMFTDFNNTPPLNSKYSQISWDELKESYKQIEKGSNASSIEVYALMLPLDNNAGRNINDVKIVFPDMIPKDFNTTTLQSWFEEQCANVLKHNLKTLVETDLKNFEKNKDFKFNLTINLFGKLKLNSAWGKDVPPFIKEFSFTDAKVKKLTGADSIIFSPTLINAEEKTAVIGKAKFKGINPFNFNTNVSIQINGLIKTTADKELSTLELEKYLNKTMTLDDSNSFIITYNWLLFSLLLILIIIFVYFLFKNSILPNKLQDLRLTGDNLEPISLPNKSKILIGGKGLSPTPDIILDNINFSLLVFGTRGDPFNLIIKKSIRIEILTDGANLYHKNILVNEKSVKIEAGDNLYINQSFKDFNFQIIKIKK